MTPYTCLANARNPALIVYLLDISGSMQSPLGTQTRHAALNDALNASIGALIKRASRGEHVSRRYDVAVFAYSDTVHDVLGGKISIAELADMDELQIPDPGGNTNTEAAFRYAHDFLASILQNYQDCPAPLVCHITDGEWNVGDPLPLAQAIRQMRVADGNVLIENVFIGDSFTRTPITNPRTWTGVRSAGDLLTPFAQKLFELSSTFPAPWAQQLENDMAYQIAADARMLVPASNTALLELALAMSQATPTR
jgi:uncharacterized protein YegL